MKHKNWELKLIFFLIVFLFAAFLAAPILLLLGNLCGTKASQENSMQQFCRRKDFWKL